MIKHLKKIEICCFDINLIIQRDVKHIYVTIHTGFPRSVTYFKEPIQRNRYDGITE